MHAAARLHTSLGCCMAAALELCAFPLLGAAWLQVLRECVASVQAGHSGLLTGLMRRHSLDEHWLEPMYGRVPRALARLGNASAFG